MSALVATGLSQSIDQSTEIRLEIANNVNLPAIEAARMLGSLSVAELLKVQAVTEMPRKIKNDAACLKKMLCLIGFMYVQAIQEAQEKITQSREDAKGKTCPDESGHYERGE